MSFATVDLVCLVLIAGVLVYDFWLARNGESGTISFRTALWSRKWPLIPLLAGILVGHLWWPNGGYTDCSLCNNQQQVCK